jgi:hypothetical protein
MVASGIGDIALVESMLEEQLSSAVKAIIARVASGALNASTADQQIRRLLSQPQDDVVLAAALDLLGSGGGDIELVEAMLSIPLTVPMRAILDRVVSKKIAPSHAQPHLKRLIAISTTQGEKHALPSPRTARSFSPVASDKAVVAGSAISETESLTSTPILSRQTASTPTPSLSTNATPPPVATAPHLNSQRSVDPRLTRSRPVNPYLNQAAPAADTEPGIERAPRNISDPRRKRGRPEEEDDNSRDIKRTAVQSRRKDSHMSLTDMINHIMYVTRRPPTAEQQRSVSVPKEVDYFATSNFAPYGAGHPDKCGRVDPAFYGSSDKKDLGLCYGTWCREDRQCLVGKNCPWRHYLDKFPIGYIWRCGENQEGYRFLQRALRNLRAGNEEPVHTYVPIRRE